MEPRELIRAVNDADNDTLKKIKAVVDFRIGNERNGGKGLSTEERLFYQSIVTTLAQHQAGFATYEDADNATRLPGFNLDSLRSAKQVVDSIYEQSLGPNTLSKAKFYRLSSACAYKWITAQQDRRAVLNRTKKVLDEKRKEGTGGDDEAVAALRQVVKVFSPETASVNRSVKGMLLALESADTVLEEAFPGYIKSGLLRMILARGSNSAAQEAVD